MQEAIVGNEMNVPQEVGSDLPHRFAREWKKIWGDRIEGEQFLVTVDEDSVLVSRFLAGETVAFDVLFSRYQDYVFHIVYGIVGSQEEARDLTQDVFLQVYRGLNRFRGHSRFATWLYRVAVNRAVDAARSQRRWKFMAPLDILERNPALAEAPIEPEAVFERKLDQTQVQKVLMLCSLSHREVLVLRYYRDLSVEEIAETLHCSVSAAKVRLHRARAAFKTHYIATYGPTPNVTHGDMGENVADSERNIKSNRRNLNTEASRR